MHNPEPECGYTPPTQTYDFSVFANQDKDIQLMSILCEAINKFQKQDNFTTDFLNDHQIAYITEWLKEKYKLEE